MAASGTCGIFIVALMMVLYLAAPSSQAQAKDRLQVTANQTSRATCKIKLECDIAGGSCVTDADACNGRLVRGGCKGKSCQCCIPGCPLDAGFFWLSSSSQCFKLMLDHGNLNWEEGKAVCESNNLKLAHPYDAIGLRSYLAQKYGNYAAFLNARDNGAGAITWLDSGEIIKNDHPLWRTGAPYSLSNACLIIQGLDAEINKPFWATQCQWKHSTRYPLCELE